MGLLHFMSIRNRKSKKYFPNQLCRKISKKFRRKQTHYTRRVSTTSDCFPPRPPPPPTIITWVWNTNKQEDVRNWLELPPEVTLYVFSKLETIDILLTVSQVCSPWRNLSKEPILYRSVFINGYDPVFRGMWMKDFIHIAKRAADRSCGKLVQFSCGNMSYFWPEDLRYVVDSSSSSLKSLRLGSCDPTYMALEETLEVVNSIPSLEQLYIRSIYFPPDTVQNIGLCCPKLKYVEIGIAALDEADVQALEIAKSMSGLCSLRFLVKGLTNNGLQAILDGCPHLEYVYIKGSSILEDDLLKKHNHNIGSITVLDKDECEIRLKVVEQVGDYGGLSMCKATFVDYYEGFF